MAAEIARAQESIARVTGETPRFFRAPAGLRNPFLDPILSRLRLQLASWTRRGFDTVNARRRRCLSALEPIARGAATSCCCTTANAARERAPGALR